MRWLYAVLDFILHGISQSFQLSNAAENNHTAKPASETNKDREICMQTGKRLI